MNIFFLDKNLKRMVQAHVDKHVLSGPGESYEMLTYAFIGTPQEPNIRFFRKTQRNHPMSKWVRHNLANWMFTLRYCEALNAEWQYRWGHPKHELHKYYLYATQLPIPEHLPKTNRRTRPPKCFGGDPQYDVGDVIESYREYYRVTKTHLFSWTNQAMPEWLL